MTNGLGNSLEFSSVDGVLPVLLSSELHLPVETKGISAHPLRSRAKNDAPLSSNSGVSENGRDSHLDKEIKSYSRDKKRVSCLLGTTAHRSAWVALMVLYTY